jgi:membrane protein YdbS with pleckstrin-like domain
LDRQKIQNVYYEQGPALQVLGLARVVIDVAGSAIDLPLVDVDEAQAILEHIREEWLAA